MKIHIFIISSLIVFETTTIADELSWVDTQVDAIKPSRVGISNFEISKVKDPFIFFKKETLERKGKKVSNVVKHSSIKKSSTSSKDDTKKQVSMVLSAIINNSALINGEWYKLDQSIKGFIVSSITRTSVVLTKGSKKLVLTTNDKNTNLKFK